MLETPILFLIFNRPDTTKSVFEEIRKQKPKYLFIAADGARKYIVGETEKCAATRDLVINNIDWDCEVKTLFRNENLGCGHAVSKAITWFFDHVEHGIILEDDCLPHSSFFNYCQEMLEKYKDNENIFSINGSNLQAKASLSDGSYSFSHYAYVWGWASWRRAWKFYDFDLKDLEKFKAKNLINKIDNRTIFKKYWIAVFEQVKNKKIDTWDYQWSFSIWNHQGMTIMPNVNLISNIGFGVEATHTTGSSPFQNLTAKDIGDISHPKNIAVNKKVDKYISKEIFNIKKKWNMKFRLPYKLKKILKFKSKKNVPNLVKFKKNLNIDNSTILLKNTNIRFDLPDKIQNRTYLTIGEKGTINAEFVFETEKGEVLIGSNVHLGGVTFVSINKIQIGNDVTISWGVTIYDHNSHSIYWDERKNDNSNYYNDCLNKTNSKDWTNVISEPVIIESKVWIGFDVIILKGVAIGEGAVVGAKSVVTKNVEPWTVVAGNPAKVIKYLPQYKKSL